MTRWIGSFNLNEACCEHNVVIFSFLLLTSKMIVLKQSVLRTQNCIQILVSLWNVIYHSEHWNVLTNNPRITSLLGINSCALFFLNFTDISLQDVCIKVKMCCLFWNNAQSRSKFGLARPFLYRARCRRKSYRDIESLSPMYLHDVIHITNFKLDDV